MVHTGTGGFRFQDPPDDHITAAKAALEEIKKFPADDQGVIYEMRCDCGSQARGRLGYPRFTLEGLPPGQYLILETS